MLFDLRSRGRRRTVQTIYLLLALLMGGGLVFFGIGGATSGGLLDAFGGGGGSVSNTFKDQADAAQKRATAHPQQAKAWAALAGARFQLAKTGDNFDQSTLTYSDKGLAMLRQADQAWQRYLALKPAKPDATTAALMAQAYDPQALNEPAKAAEAQEIVVSARKPSSGQYAQLAVYAYLAGETRTGHLAEQKALSLESDKARRKQLKAAIAQAKKAGAASAATGAGAGGGSSGSSPVAPGGG